MKMSAPAGVEYYLHFWTYCQWLCQTGQQEDFAASLTREILHAEVLRIWYTGQDRQKDEVTEEGEKNKRRAAGKPVYHITFGALSQLLVSLTTDFRPSNALRADIQSNSIIRALLRALREILK